MTLYLLTFERLDTDLSEEPVELLSLHTTLEGAQMAAVALEEVNWGDDARPLVWTGTASGRTYAPGRESGPRYYYVKPMEVQP